MQQGRMGIMCLNEDEIQDVFVDVRIPVAVKYKLRTCKLGISIVSLLKLSKS